MTDLFDVLIDSCDDALQEQIRELMEDGYDIEDALEELGLLEEV